MSNQHTSLAHLNAGQLERVIRTESMVRAKFQNEGTGHDWFHIERVYNVAMTLGEHEGADLYVTALGALLHDIADHKFHDGDLAVGPQVAEKWLRELGEEDEVIQAVSAIVKEISFKGAGVDTPMSSKAGACVQDADRLDAIGAIGVARCFAFGGSIGQPLHDPQSKVEMHGTFEDYVNKRTSSVNHFYEKLLLLKDRMNTEAGKAMAEKRHQYMEKFLEQFYAEWEGKS